MSEHLEGVEIERVSIHSTFEGDGGLDFIVGREGVTRIEAFTKSGMHADIPYVRVWCGDHPKAEFCQHNIVGVYFKAKS